MASKTAKLKEFFSQMTGRFFVPPQLYSSQDKKVLHLSDTPTSLYPAIAKLINCINPDVIIHTGDLADDIKLEHNPHILDSYTRSVTPFIEMLEKGPAQEIYIVPGNHDHLDFLTQQLHRIQLVKEGTQLEIDWCTFGLAHKMKRLPNDSQFYLYGHNFRLPSNQQQQANYLNGLQHINVILLPSQQVIKIPYPWSTNHDRKMNPVGFPKTT